MARRSASADCVTVLRRHRVVRGEQRRGLASRSRDRRDDLAQLMKGLGRGSESRRASWQVSHRRRQCRAEATTRRRYRRQCRCLRLSGAAHREARGQSPRRSSRSVYTRSRHQRDDSETASRPLCRSRSSSLTSQHGAPSRWSRRTHARTSSPSPGHVTASRESVPSPKE